MRRFLRERAAAWVRRRQGPDSLPVTLHRRRLYILPTRAGLGFGVLLSMMLLAGLNYGNSLALFVTFLLGGLVLVTMHHSHRNLLGTTLLEASPLPGFAGQTATLQLALGNDSPLLRHRIEAAVPDLPATPQPGSEANPPRRKKPGGRQIPTATIDIAPGSIERLDITLPTPKRGVIRIERLRIATSHPFGLFRTWTWVHEPIEITVYPRPRGSLPMPTTGGNKSGSQGAAGAGVEEWVGLRPFREGDSPRQVDWKAYARGAPLLVKEYSAAGSDICLFDFSSLAGLDTESRLEQLARWIVDAEARSERYGLVLPNVRIAPDRGPQHRHRCLKALALHGH